MPPNGDGGGGGSSSSSNVASAAAAKPKPQAEPKAKAKVRVRSGPPPHKAEKPPKGGWKELRRLDLPWPEVKRTRKRGPKTRQQKYEAYLYRLIRESNWHALARIETKECPEDFEIPEKPKVEKNQKDHLRVMEIVGAPAEDDFYKYFQLKNCMKWKLQPEESPFRRMLQKILLLNCRGTGCFSQLRGCLWEAARLVQLDELSVWAKVSACMTSRPLNKHSAAPGKLKSTIFFALYPNSQLPVFMKHWERDESDDETRVKKEPGVKREPRVKPEPGVKPEPEVRPEPGVNRGLAVKREPAVNEEEPAAKCMRKSQHGTKELHESLLTPVKREPRLANQAKLEFGAQHSVKDGRDTQAARPAMHSRDNGELHIVSDGAIAPARQFQPSSGERRKNFVVTKSPVVKKEKKEEEEKELMGMQVDAEREREKDRSLQAPSQEQLQRMKAEQGQIHSRATPVIKREIREEEQDPRRPVAGRMIKQATHDVAALVAGASASSSSSYCYSSPQSCVASAAAAAGPTFSPVAATSRAVSAASPVVKRELAQGKVGQPGSIQVKRQQKEEQDEERPTFRVKMEKASGGLRELDLTRMHESRVAEEVVNSQDMQDLENCNWMQRKLWIVTCLLDTKISLEALFPHVYSRIHHQATSCANDDDSKKSSDRNKTTNAARQDWKEANEDHAQEGGRRVMKRAFKRPASAPGMPYALTEEEEDKELEEHFQKIRGWWDGKIDEFPLRPSLGMPNMNLDSEDDGDTDDYESEHSYSCSSSSSVVNLTREPPQEAPPSGHGGADDARQRQRTTRGCRSGSAGRSPQLAAGSALASSRNSRSSGGSIPQGQASGTEAALVGRRGSRSGIAVEVGGNGNSSTIITIGGSSSSSTTAATTTTTSGSNGNSSSANVGHSSGSQEAIVELEASRRTAGALPPDAVRDVRAEQECTQQRAEAERREAQQERPRAWRRLRRIAEEEAPAPAVVATPALAVAAAAAAAPAVRAAAAEEEGMGEEEAEMREARQESIGQELRLDKRVKRRRFRKGPE